MPYKDPEQRKAYAQKHYRDNIELYAQRNRQRRSAKEQLVEDLKTNGFCTDCNLQYHFCQMQYDHVDSDKIASVSDLIRNGTMQQVLDEINKCELVCANCHSLRTWKRKVGIEI